MPKIRQTVSIVFEYEPNPEHYPPSATLEEMALIDAHNYENDGDFLIDELANGEEVSVGVHSEIIHDK